MSTMRAVLFGLIAVLIAGGAHAAPAAGPSTAGEALTFGGQSTAVGPRINPQQPTPLFTIGGLAVGIWTRLPPPYNAAANRNLAADPLP
jgi:hypothetical protein